MVHRHIPLFLSLETEEIFRERIHYGFADVIIDDRDYIIDVGLLRTDFPIQFTQGNPPLEVFLIENVYFKHQFHIRVVIGSITSESDVIDVLLIGFLEIPISCFQILIDCPVENQVTGLADLEMLKGIDNSFFVTIGRTCTARENNDRNHDANLDKESYPAPYG